MFRVSKLFFSLVSLLMLGVANAARAIPIESFRSEYELACPGDRTCEGALRSTESIGGYLTFSIDPTGKGPIRLLIGGAAERGHFHLLGRKRSWRRLRFEWDGDSKPTQLSGAGLRCADLTAYGATAIMIHDLRLTASCGKGEALEDCAPIELEMRMFDGRDPSGQSYSAALVRRPLGASGKDLLIPFSAFTAEGPNGLGDIGCVGAIDLSFIPDEELDDVSVFIGPIETNGQVPPTATPTPTATLTLTATPTITPIPTDTPVVTPTRAATPTSTASPTMTASPTVATTVTFMATPTPTATPTQSVTLIITPVVTATGTPTVTVTAISTPVVDENVYGSVIAGLAGTTGK